MTTPFSYYLYHKPTGKHYYGIKFAKGCQPTDLWVTYFSTSEPVKALIKEYGANSFTYEIRRTFETGEQAVLWEHKVLRRLDAAGRANWLNRHNGGTKFRSPLTHSQATRDILSRKLRGRLFTGEHIQKLSEAQSRVWEQRNQSGFKLDYTKAAKYLQKNRYLWYTPERNAKMAASKTGTKRQYQPDGTFKMVKTHIA